MKKQRPNRTQIHNVGEKLVILKHVHPQQTGAVQALKEDLQVHVHVVPLSISILKYGDC